MEITFETTGIPDEGQQWESNPQPPHYECGALPIEAMLAFGVPPALIGGPAFLPYLDKRVRAGKA